MTLGAALVLHRWWWMPLQLVLVEKGAEAQEM
jgi:hypothetical protein